jgi:hypothetical protein
MTNVFLTEETLEKFPIGHLVNGGNGVTQMSTMILLAYRIIRMAIS